MEDKIKKITKSKGFIITLILLLISLIVVTGTYAWFTWSSTENTGLTTTIGKLADVIFTTGPDINTTSLAPVFYYTDGEKTTFTITNRSTEGYGVSISVNLNITTLPEELRNESFKYKLIKGEEEIASGNFSTYEDGSVVPILVNVPFTTVNGNYTFYLYIDANMENSLDMMNKNFVASIEVSAQEPMLATQKISNLYNPDGNTTPTVNSITYNLDTTNRLMADSAGNIRYYGADDSNISDDLKNYIYFNCEEYPSTNCETWRIIGIIDGKLKIMRGETIGAYSWDTSASTVNGGYGINEWSQADLMKLLNPGYKNNQDLDTDGNTITVNNSLYWTGAQGTSGTCYSDQNNITTTCDFTSKGLKNDITRNLISEHTYTLKGFSGSSMYSDEVYTQETSTGTVIQSPSDGVTRTLSWSGNIALPYPSDYGYAADLSQCQQQLYNYNDSTCASNNWMTSIIGSNYAWLLTPNSSYANIAFDVTTLSRMNTGYTLGDFDVLPTLYLDENVIINGGDGSSEHPYQIANYENYNAKFFDGKTDYVDAGYGNHDFGKSLTIGARFNADAIRSSNGFMISNVEGAGFGLYVSLDNRAYILVYSSSASAYKNVYTTTTIEPGKWYNLVATYDGSYVRLYLNGEADGTPLAFTDSLKVSTADVVLGGNALGNYANTEFFDGMISHTFVSSDVLTAEQIAENFSTDFNYTENANTLIYYDFTE